MTENTLTQDTLAEQNVEKSLFQQGIFLENLARYYMNFLETDFHKKPAPKRSVKLRDNKGQLAGLNLRKYKDFRSYIWHIFIDKVKLNNSFEISRGKFKSRMKISLRNFIDNSIDDIEQETIDDAIFGAITELKNLKEMHYDNWSLFYEEGLEAVKRHVLKQVIVPLSIVLEKPLAEEKNLGIETIFELEEQLLDLVCKDIDENADQAFVEYFNKGIEASLIKDLTVFLQQDLLITKLKAFFDGFSASDLYLEINEIYENQRLNDKQELYLYFCDIHYNKKSYPLFYFPLNIEKKDGKFILSFELRIYINKKAIEYIIQEYAKESDRMISLSSLKNRIIYMEPNQDSVVKCLQQLVSDISSHFSFSNDLDLTNHEVQKKGALLVDISNDIYLCLFDRSDEALVNDYEELIDNLVQGRSNPITEAFRTLINGYVIKEPISYNSDIENDWDGKTVSKRLVYESPIPLNEEQKKIVQALKQGDCKFIAVQGPPGTGKSHTITAIAFDAILNDSSVLILSDKKEALDVVEDKIVQTINKVRISEDFQNPILRLDKKNFSKIFSSSTIDTIKNHHKAAKQQKNAVDGLITTKSKALENDISDTINQYQEISLSEINELNTLENEIKKRIAFHKVRSENVDWDEDFVVNFKIFCTFINEKTEKPVLKLFLNLLKKHCDNWVSDDVSHMILLFETVSTLHREGHLSYLCILLKLTKDTQNELQEILSSYDNLANSSNNSMLNAIKTWLNRKKIDALNAELSEKLNFSQPINIRKDHRKLLGMLEDFKKAYASFKTTGLDKDGFFDDFLETLSFPFDENSYIFSNDGTYTLGFFKDLTSDKSKKTLEGFGIDLTFDVTENKERLEDYLNLSHLLFDEFYKNDSISNKFAEIPELDYSAVCSQLEQLQTIKMTNLIDERVINFAENNRATTQTLKRIISKKQKFPRNDFQKLKKAFPCIIAGIRDYAEYIPLESNLFDLVIIDEASQVSIAQAFPAILRAKKVLVLGDNKQFSNVKTSHASNSMNNKYMNDVKNCFQENISKDLSKMVRVDQFNIKTSILEFFDFVSNYNVMLKKHFRGYRELISFSSKYFYDANLQAIKIRGKSIEEVLKFTVLEHDEKLELEEHANTNPFEAEFIINELTALVKSDARLSVGIITPFSDQQKFIANEISKSELSEKFYSKLKLKVMTFDTCQGEERDFIYYSMVASPVLDKTNYIFASDLDKTSDDEKKIRLQRLNVGFSRSKEKMHFVLSKPINDFNGAIGIALRHYKNVLEQAKSEPSEVDTDPKSPMETKVLEWIKNTAFYQKNREHLELKAQFPVGEYLQQLDHSYKHPRYRCDFLLQYRNNKGVTTNIIIEYDGFKEHFTDLEDVNALNYQSYYKASDVEREKILESYGYKFIRINKFNLGSNPIETLSARLAKLVDKQNLSLNITEDILEKAKQLSAGNAKECPKCHKVKTLDKFKDNSLISGVGRNCSACKKTNSNRKPTNNHMTAELEELDIPACPRCGVDMTMRFRREDNNPFWGCPKFPYCKGTKNI